MLLKAELKPGLYYFKQALNQSEIKVILNDVKSSIVEAPLYIPTMPDSGNNLSVKMSNMGEYGWISDKYGYRYQKTHPVTSKSWPKISDNLLGLWHKFTENLEKPQESKQEKRSEKWREKRSENLGKKSFDDSWESSGEKLQKHQTKSEKEFQEKSQENYKVNSQLGSKISSELCSENRYRMNLPEDNTKFSQNLSKYPNCCLINYYDLNAKMGLHVDKDEKDFSYPVLSISIGASAIFRYGGKKRSDKTHSIKLEHGDIIILHGESRLIYHGIDRIIKDNKYDYRVNLTMRKVKI